MEDAFSKGKLRAAIQRILRVTESNFSGIVHSFLFCFAFWYPHPYLGVAFRVFTEMAFLPDLYLSGGSCSSGATFLAAYF